MPENPQGENLPSPEIIKDFIELQKHKAENETRELAIKEQEIASNERLALRSMELQADHLKVRPAEMRKNITRLAYVLGFVLVIVFGFICYLLTTQNKDFAVLIIEKGAYLVVAFISYYAGKKNGQKSKVDNNSDSNFEEVE
ncbi:hypothetical protein ACR79B_20680 [Sphingobacterium spiritivorum]|uniref:hypothetical protein n=1 Tax=Sphingobacterium spiritivorum TaxID=258 RepID=UPI003DA6BD07